MPFLIVVTLLAGLGFALHERARPTADGVLSGDFFNSERDNAPISFGAPPTQSVASVLPSALELSGVSSLLNSFSVPTATGTNAAPSVPELLTQQQQAPEAEPTLTASEPLPALCEVDVRNHPGYHVVCNGKQYS